VNVMSYHTSKLYSPIEGMEAYTHYFSGVIAMGVEVPPEQKDGHVYTIGEIKRLAEQVVATANARNRPPSMMIWSLQKQTVGDPSEDNPSAAMISSFVCKALGLQDCGIPIIP